MRNPDWNLIRTFLTVAECGSLLAAASRLRLTQPAIGRHINQLEADLELSLFVRGRSGMKLTEAGLSLAEDATAMRGEFDRLLLKAAGRGDRVSGTVRITASRVVSIYILPPILARLKAAEPEIEVELVPDNAVANLLARDADIAVRMVRPTQNDLIAQKIADIPMGTFAHRSYLETRGTPQTIDDLSEHLVIGYDREDRMLAAMHQMGLDADRSFFAFRTDDEVAAWELVKAGAGIGFAQLHIGTRTADIVRILPDLAIPTLPLWLAAHQELNTSRRIRRAMDFLAGELRKLPLST
ncbi:LysR family transcriptional regulator [Rhizobium sp. KVB221]|uniref:LysR family transcriptional regulator n=1 Tax=Rhizobium setariae TaxID=2801340 RepID=A0A936YU07_9HYPH|nr:LysR family transcriptional regulator [Rhizobium setariae]MBL0374957.1 LysR family transcriptional regulator [Rhizobium setariae]